MRPGSASAPVAGLQEGPGDEAGLLAAWRTGDADAGEELLRRYTPLVRAAASVHTAAGLAPGTLIQEGMIGLLRTLFAFRAETTAAFFSTAALAVAQQIQTAVDAAEERSGA